MRTRNSHVLSKKLLRVGCSFVAYFSSKIFPEAGNKKTYFQKNKFSKNQIFKKTNFQKTKFSKKQIFKKTNFQKNKFSKKQIFKKPNFQKTKFSKNQKNGNLDENGNFGRKSENY